MMHCSDVLNENESDWSVRPVAKMTASYTSNAPLSTTGHELVRFSHHHSSGPLIPMPFVKCLLCLSEMPEINALSHIHHHFQYKPYRCTLCGSSYVSFDILQKHALESGHLPVRFEYQGGNPSIKRICELMFSFFRDFADPDARECWGALLKNELDVLGQCDFDVDKLKDQLFPDTLFDDGFATHGGPRKSEVVIQELLDSDDEEPTTIDCVSSQRRSPRKHQDSVPRNRHDSSNHQPLKEAPSSSNTARPDHSGNKHKPPSFGGDWQNCPLDSAPVTTNCALCDTNLLSQPVVDPTDSLTALMVEHAAHHLTQDEGQPALYRCPGHACPGVASIKLFTEHRRRSHPDTVVAIGDVCAVKRLGPKLAEIWRDAYGCSPCPKFTPEVLVTNRTCSNIAGVFSDFGKPADTEAGEASSESRGDSGPVGKLGNGSMGIEDPVECEVCGIEVPNSRTTRVDHVWDCHVPGVAFRCLGCDAVLSTRAAADRHKTKSHPGTSVAIGNNLKKLYPSLKKSLAQCFPAYAADECEESESSEESENYGAMELAEKRDKDGLSGQHSGRKKRLKTPILGASGVKRQKLDPEIRKSPSPQSSVELDSSGCEVIAPQAEAANIPDQLQDDALLYFSDSETERQSKKLAMKKKGAQKSESPKEECADDSSSSFLGKLKDEFGSLYKCCLCNAVVQSSGIKTHVYMHIQEKYPVAQCPHCNFSDHQTHTVRKHIQEAHKSIKCDSRQRVINNYDKVSHHYSRYRDQCFPDTSQYHSRQSDAAAKTPRGRPKGKKRGPKGRKNPVDQTPGDILVTTDRQELVKDSPRSAKVPTKSAVVCKLCSAVVTVDCSSPNASKACLIAHAQTHCKTGAQMRVCGVCSYRCFDGRDQKHHFNNEHGATPTAGQSATSNEADWKMEQAGKNTAEYLDCLLIKCFESHLHSLPGWNAKFLICFLCQTVTERKGAGDHLKEHCHQKMSFFPCNKCSAGFFRHAEMLNHKRGVHGGVGRVAQVVSNKAVSIEVNGKYFAEKCFRDQITLQELLPNKNDVLTSPSFNSWKSPSKSGGKKSSPPIHPENAPMDAEVNSGGSESDDEGEPEKETHGRTRSSATRKGKRSISPARHVRKLRSSSGASKGATAGASGSPEILSPRRPKGASPGPKGAPPVNWDSAPPQIPVNDSNSDEANGGAESTDSEPANDPRDQANRPPTLASNEFSTLDDCKMCQMQVPRVHREAHVWYHGAMEQSGFSRYKCGTCGYGLDCLITLVEHFAAAHPDQKQVKFKMFENEKSCGLFAETVAQCFLQK